MNPLLKGSLNALVLALLLTLFGMMGFAAILKPGYYLISAVTPLPSPYHVTDPNAPHSTIVAATSFVFWLLLFLAWVFIGHARARARKIR